MRARAAEAIDSFNDGLLRSSSNFEFIHAILCSMVRNPNRSSQNQLGQSALFRGCHDRGADGQCLYRRAGKGIPIGVEYQHVEAEIEVAKIVLPAKPSEPDSRFQAPGLSVSNSALKRTVTGDDANQRKDPASSVRRLRAAGYRNAFVG